MTWPPHSSSPSKMKRTFSGGRPLGVEHGFVGLEETEHLALVVRGATGVEPAVAHGRLEGRSAPFLEGVGRLHVVVAIDEQRGPAGDGRTLGPDDGMAVPLDESATVGQPRPLELVMQPFGGTAAVGGVYREGAHARNGEETRTARPEGGSARVRRSWYPWPERYTRWRPARDRVTGLTALPREAAYPAGHDHRGTRDGARRRPPGTPETTAGGRMSRGQLTVVVTALALGAIAPRLPAQDTSAVGHAPDTSGYNGTGGVDTSAQPGRVGPIDTSAATDTLRSGWTRWGCRDRPIWRTPPAPWTRRPSRSRANSRGQSPSRTGDSASAASP